MRAPALASCLLALALPLAAQRYSGTFTMAGQAGPVTLVLQQAGNGIVTGTMSGNGVSFQIEARPEEDAIAGMATGQQGRLFFQAGLEGDQLVMLFVEPGPDGSPNYDTAQQLVFARQAAGAAGGAMGMGGAGATGQPPGGMQPAQPSQPGGLDDGTPLGREWRQGLAGKKLTRMSSYSSGSSGGYSSRDDLFLCSSGEYQYRGSSSVSVDVGGAFGNSGGNEGETGRWRVITEGQVAGLELHLSSGGTRMVRLDLNDGTVFANGDRVFVTAAEVCQ